MFGADRNRTRSDSSDLGAADLPGNGTRAPLSAGIPRKSKIPPPSQVYSERGSIPEVQNPGDPQEFPLPFVISGAKPNIATPGSKAKTTVQPAPKGSTAIARSPAAGSATAKLGGSPKPGSPAETTTASDKTKDKSDSGTTKKSSKPLMIDPSLLEKALKNRNLSRPQPPAG
jgi:hypothetical protein